MVVDGAAVARRKDRLAGEEPLEIRVEDSSGRTTRIAVTMRTPGHDFELAAGFLKTEGLVAAPAEIDRIRYCADVERAEQEFNVVTVTLRGAFDPGALQRNFYATSSCGVCGKAAIEQLEVACSAIPVVERFVDGARFAAMSDALRTAQRVFDATGGLHATGLFDREGSLIVAREDVGRHNALDKLVGERFLAGQLPVADHVVLVSGRASFELVQKAAVAGAPVLVAVSAPSSLAVQTARRLGITLVGFARGDRYVIYTHPERVILPA